MGKCIFCKSDGPFTTKEHILPESLGGGDWSLLKIKWFCDKCQNLFGSKIEQQALGDYPFSFIRVFLGIPTKKKKSPLLNDPLEGKIFGSSIPKAIFYEPPQHFKASLFDGRKTQMRLIAETLKPKIICQFLLKMGIECIADGDYQEALSHKYDAAREFALTGKKTGDWWYLQITDEKLFKQFVMGEASEVEIMDSLYFEINNIADEEESAKMFHLRFFGFDFFMPLETRIKPDVSLVPDANAFSPRIYSI